MPIFRLIYASKKADDHPQIDIEGILSSAIRNNTKNGITGILCFGRDSFLQCLEGSRVAINSTFNRIVHDDRHQDIHLVGYDQIDRRQFESWSMGYIPECSFTKPLVTKFSETDIFDPFLMSSQSAVDFLLELSRSTKTISSADSINVLDSQSQEDCVLA